MRLARALLGGVAATVSARKRQYWVEEGGRWKIACEPTVGRQNLRLPESFPQPSKKDELEGRVNPERSIR